jgi:hypothetical protein
VASYCPAIDWLSYFLAMDTDRQQEFETDLAARDISLGEYMEIVEQAAMEAYSRTPSDADRFHEEELLVIVSAMLSDYVSRKRMLTRQTGETSGTAASESAQSQSPRQPASEEWKALLLARRLRLRSAIHSRIEAIKYGLATP